MITEEDKKLLLKDLCARLPYGVIVRGVFIHYNKNDDKIRYEEIDNKLDYRHLNRYESLKPYLRPMSSMTEKERKEYKDMNVLDNCDEFSNIKKNIEGLRWRIQNQLSHTCIDSFQTRLAMQYGIIEYKPWDGKFYFEKINDNK